MRTLVLLSMITLMAMLLPACDLIPQRVGAQAQRYEVISVRRPKRFRVDLRNVDTGEVFRHVSVRKRCSNWRKTQVGSVWTLTEATYRDRNGKTFHRVEGARALCQR